MNTRQSIKKPGNLPQYLAVLFCFISFAILTSGCAREDISLRPFPYPYKAGLAFCSDIDYTNSIEEFLAIQEYLCTNRDTRWGNGLGLEVGNSFWFFDPTGKSSFTIFDTLGVVNDSASKVIEDFILAGYIDCLHTYGDYTGIGYNEARLPRAIQYFQDRGLTIPAWVNHGDETNTQRIGPRDEELGDNPDYPEYHTNYFPDLGIRYVESWRVTHRIAMEKDAGFRDFGFHLFDIAYSIKEMLKPGVFDPVTNKHLLNPIKLDDGQEYWRFRRFINDDGNMGKYGVDVGYLAHQLRPENLDRLISSGGYMVVYTHFGANEDYDEWIPEHARKAFKGLSERFQEGSIFITTTTSLLDYNLMTRFLDWSWEKTEQGYTVNIGMLDDPLRESPVQQEAVNLRGLTFYTPDPENTSIILNGIKVENTSIHPPDDTDQSSISIPWLWLEYPEGY